MKIKLLLLTLVTVISVKSYPQPKNDSLYQVLHMSSGIEKVNLLNDIAYSYRLENTEFALECASKAAFLSDSLDYDTGKGYAAHILGFISYLNGGFESAKKDLAKAIQIAKSIEDIMLKKRAYETLALLLEESGFPEESLKYYQLSYDQSRLLNDPVGIGISLMGAGRAYEMMNQHNLALQNNLQVMNLFLKLGNKVGVAKSCITLANIYNTLGIPDSTLFYLDQAEVIITDLEYHELLLDLYLEKINIYSEKNLDSSLLYAEKAIELSGDLGRPYLKRDLMLQASDMYSQRGEFQVAYDFHQSYAQINDSLIHLQQPVISGRLELTLNDALYTSQESIAERLDLLNPSESVSYSRLLTGFGVLVLCISGLMVWLVVRYRLQKRSLARMDVLQTEIARMTSELTNKDKTILDLRRVKEDSSPDSKDDVLVGDTRQLTDKMKARGEIKDSLSQNALELFISGEWDKLMRVRQELSIEETGYWLPDDTDGNNGHLNLEHMTASLITIKSSGLEDRITFHHAKNPVINMYCHPGSLLLLVSCLLQNAIEAIEEEGDIFIDYQARDDLITYRIIDNGKGIAAKDLSQIFEPFFSTKKSVHNLGLGLSLSREIIRFHNAVLKVNSKLGTGTEVQLEFFYSC